VAKAKKAKPKTVKAVIYVAVLASGEYNAAGWGHGKKLGKPTESDCNDMMSTAVEGLHGPGGYHFVRVEVDLPVPDEVVEAKGKVAGVEPGEP
jgi:hypothetical protein